MKYTISKLNFDTYMDWLAYTFPIFLLVLILLAVGFIVKYIWDALGG